MARFIVEGGRKIEGEVFCSAGKNAVLPILASSALTEETEILNLPSLSDVDNSLKVLKTLGSKVTRDGEKAKIENSSLGNIALGEELTGKMRSSVLFLGSLLGRFNKAEIAFPGGCELGSRPIDIHLDAFRKMGAQIEEIHGRIKCLCPNGLKGESHTLPFPSVGATENIMIASVLAKGDTYIYNMAREPEILDLAKFLNKAGAKITVGSSCIHIEGVKKLGKIDFKVMPDRIEAATFLSYAVCTKGKILVRDCNPHHLRSVLSVFEDMGCKILEGKEMLYLETPKVLKPVRKVKTMPYPGFPTDAQALIMSSLLFCKGSSIIVENIFDSRFKHVGELKKLGADIECEGRTAVINGGKKLYSASLNCTDLRGGASLVGAGLSATGQSVINDIYHIDRGYCKLEEKLNSLGVYIKRESGE